MSFTKQGQSFEYSPGFKNNPYTCIYVFFTYIHRERERERARARERQRGRERQRERERELLVMVLLVHGVWLRGYVVGI